MTKFDLAVLMLSFMLMVILTIWRDRELRKLRKQVMEHDVYLKRLSAWLHRRKLERMANREPLALAPPPLTPDDLKDLPKDVADWWAQKYPFSNPTPH